MQLFRKLPSYSLEFVNFTVGAVTLTFELTAARIITPYIGNTIYTWTSIIGVILASLAAGYALGGKLADARQRRMDVVLLLLIAAALLVVVNISKDRILREISGLDIALQWQALIGGIILFALPTLCLGAVSPYLARLRIVSVKDSGQKVARMSSWGTVGSLFGTFLTGYVLFGYLGTRIIMVLLTLVLIAVSFVLTQKEMFIARLLVALWAVLSIWTTSPVLVRGLVSDTDTHYARIVIRDSMLNEQPVRLLQTEGKYVQSGRFLDNSDRLAFGYTRAFAYVANMQPQFRQALIIGGGAFTFPAYLEKTYPSAHVDTVEIDDKLLSLSQQYFGYSKSSNSTVYSEDGRAYLNRNEKRYDFIFSDAYGSISPPFQLLTQEAVIKMRDSLTESGVVAANIISALNNEPLPSIVKTYQSVFKHVSLFPVAYGQDPAMRQNVILVASDHPFKETLKAAAKTAEEKSFASRLYSPGFSGGFVLTDNYAPVERFTSSNF